MKHSSVPTAPVPSDLAPARAAVRVRTVLRRLNALATLADPESVLVEECGRRIETHGAGSVLLNEGAAQPAPLLLLSGWACRQRLLPDGRRQIFDFIIPGDMIGFHVSPRPLTRVGVAALTRVETVDVSALRMAAMDGAAYPGLARVMAAIACEDEQRLLDHVVRLGRLTAYERTVHLLLELRDRLAVVGLGDERRFPLAITQEALADALGLSVVHINRILQQLRREGLIEMRASQTVLLDLERLNTIAGLDRTLAANA